MILKTRPIDGHHDKNAVLFKLLADQTRLGIIKLLINAEAELCVNDIARQISISQSATSHQLAKLEARNIVSSFRRGQTVCYHLKDSDIVRRIKAIITLLSSHDS